MLGLGLDLGLGLRTYGLVNIPDYKRQAGADVGSVSVPNTIQYLGYTMQDLLTDDVLQDTNVTPNYLMAATSCVL